MTTELSLPVAVIFLQQLFYPENMIHNIVYGLQI